MHRRTAILFVGDLLVGLASLGAGFAISNRGVLPLMPYPRIILFLATFVLAHEAAFYFTGMYRGLWRYAGIRDMGRVFVGVTSGQVLWGALIALFSFKVSVFAIIAIWLVLLAGALGVRLAFRIRDDFIKAPLKRTVKHKRVLIAGAGQAGALVIRDIQRDPLRRYLPVCLVDDDPSKQQMELCGVPIKGTLADIRGLIDALGIDEVILAMPSAPKALLRQLHEQCRGWGMPFKIVPGINELIDGRVSVNQIREVQVEDLLGREPVQLDLEEIAGYLQGKRVLVTGAGGSIGSEICRQVSRFHPELLIMLGRGENSIFEIQQEMKAERPHVPIQAVITDVRDKAAVERLFMQTRPHVVFHAAAHKHVPLMEDWPEEAVKNNVFGTLHVVDAAQRHGAERFVLISTDKAVNPTSIMGATKRVAELIMQSYARSKKGPVFTAVRFGNVLGSRGSVVPLFQKQIARGGPVTVTHPDMTRYFMTIPEAVQLVIQAGAMARGGEIFVLDMGEPVRILDLAENMIRLSGFEPGKDIEIVFTGPRPGEKLFEEILTAEEGTRATRNSRIYVANMPSELGKKRGAAQDRFWDLLLQEDVSAVLSYIAEQVLSGEAQVKRQVRKAKDEVATMGAH